MNNGLYLRREGIIGLAGLVCTPFFENGGDPFGGEIHQLRVSEISETFEVAVRLLPNEPFVPIGVPVGRRGEPKSPKSSKRSFRIRPRRIFIRRTR